MKKHNFVIPTGVDMLVDVTRIEEFNAVCGLMYVAELPSPIHVTRYQSGQVMIWDTAGRLKPLGTERVNAIRNALHQFFDGFTEGE